MTDQTEALLIGACLLDHRQLAVTRRTVHAGSFGREAHRTLWTVMCQIADADAIPDPPSVLDRLIADGRIEQVGGATAVHELAAAVGASANAQHYAGKVVRDHRARQLDAACAQARADLFDGADPDQVLASVTGAAGHATGAGQWSPSQLADRLADLLSGGSGKTWSTGWPKVDEIWRPAPGTLTVVTGVPGAGKSTFMDPVLLFQVAHGRKIAVWSPEQAPAEEHLRQLLWTWHGRQPTSVPADLAGWDGLLTILDPDDTSLASVLARASGLHATAGLDVLLIDPWNKLAHEHGTQRQDLYLQEQLGRLTRFARSSGVAVWVVAHPTKLQRMVGTDTCWMPPTIYDISGGAEWANQADVVLTVWRDAAGEKSPPHVVQIIVSKVRRAWWGRVARRTLRFDPASRNYAEPTIAMEEVA